MSEIEAKQDIQEQEPPKESFLKVIVHSFFVIPFLIAVFCVLLFAAMHLLTSEKRSAYDYLKDVKTGGESKRWQAAFELSKMLSNPQTLPKEEKFYREMLDVFEHSRHDQNQLVRQYLALAMGRSGQVLFVEPLTKALKEESGDNIATMIFALGMLKDAGSAKVIESFLSDDNARVRSIAATALGNIGQADSVKALRKALADPEPNVQWGAALSLARMGHDDGAKILLNLLDREYLKKFPEVDAEEQTQLMLAAVDASAKIKNEDVLNRVMELSKTDQNMRVRAKAMDIVNGK